MNKSIHFLTLFAALLLGACSSDTGSLENNASSALEKGYEMASGYRSNALVDIIYQDLVDQNEDLAALEKELKALKEQKEDSLYNYTQYSNYNDQYYASALNLNNNIHDSLLKNSIELLIRKSQNQNAEKNAALDLNIATLHNRYNKLQDQYIALKIIRTLGMIETYQVQNRPPIQPFTSLNKRFDKCFKQIDSLIETK